MTGRTLGADTAATGTGLTFSAVDSELVGISVAEISILYRGLPTFICSTVNRVIRIKLGATCIRNYPAYQKAANMVD